MRSFSIVREVGLPPDQVWQRLTAWENHGKAVPFTTVTRTADGLLARTKVGPFTIDDSMELQLVDPPRRFFAVKTGAVVKGEIDVGIEPGAISTSSSPVGAGPASSRVVWRQWVKIRAVPALADPIVVAMCKLMYGRLIDRLLLTPHEA